MTFLNFKHKTSNKGALAWLSQPTLDFSSSHDLQPHIRLQGGRGACLRSLSPAPSVPRPPQTCVHTLGCALFLSPKKR